jgi:Ser/Thr protein kinase RdoA (MazF antagonist)
MTAGRAGTSGGGGPYRARLEVLAAGGIVEAQLDAWAARRTERLGPWRRVSGKLRPLHCAWALLVYEGAGGLTVQVRLLEDTDSAGVGRPDAARPAGGLGRIEILACTEDPALPGLSGVLAALEAPRVVRYHPGSRCTVHGGADAAARYVKVLSDEVDDQQGARARWAVARSGALPFAVAEPLGWDGSSRSSWYGVVPGGPVAPRLFGTDGVQLARLVGAAVGRLASAPLSPSRRDDASTQLARTGRGLARAAAAIPALAPGLRRAADSLTRVHERLDPRPLVPVHGAAHLGQWLVDDAGRLGLVDFDRSGWGEPEFDVATFVVALREWTKVQPTAELEAAVVDGFREVTGGFDAERFALYLLHRRLAKACRTAASLRPDAEERAAPLLEDLQHPLSRLARN